MFKLRNKISLVLFGFCLSLLLIEFSLRLCGFVFMSFQDEKNKFSPSDKGEYRILCLGESTTAGLSDSYPQQLEGILLTRRPDVKFSLINKGIPGINSTYILAQLNDNLDKYNPDIVVVMMGINDKGSSYWDSVSPLPKFIEELRIVKLAKLIFEAFKKRLDKADFILAQGWTLGLSNLRTPHEDKAINSDYLNNLVLQATQLREENNYFESENIFRKVLRKDLTNSSDYVGLAWIASGRGDTVEAENLFNKAIALDSKQIDAFIGLGWLFRNEGRYVESELKFCKALDMNKERDDAYTGLGWLYKDQAMYSDAEKWFKRAIEINPNNVYNYLGLAWLFLDLNNYNQAVLTLKKALNLNKQQKDVYYVLATAYLLLDNYSESESYFKKAIRLNPTDSRNYSYLALVYQKMNMPERAKQASRKAATLRLIADDSLTIRNYIKMKRVLDARGIRMVCIQYPMLSIEPLKDLFRGEKGVIFVENKQNFKEALKNRDISDYFTDMFAGEFGHCTTLGNRLIAQNVAEAILKVYVKKQ